MDEYRKYEPIFGSWKIERLIGKGSFGKVFEISREEYGTTYKAALKIITVPQDEDDVKSRLAQEKNIATISEYYEGILKEIINENEIMSKLKGNSNIVSYEDHQIIPHEDGIGYDVLIRMELLTPLLDVLLERPLTEKEVVKLGIDICKALELCHRKNIIHRDIKPQNIFISENGDYKLGDFGIARTMEKTTGGMSKKGTYKYMAPEVFKGENYDSTVDLYSLGIVLYTLLNGNRGPFLPAPPAKVTHNDEEKARMRRFRGEEIPAPRDAGTMLAYIIKKACESDPSKRYSTAEQMRRDLESYLANYDTLPADNAPAYIGSSDAADNAPAYNGSSDAADSAPAYIGGSIPADSAPAYNAGADLMASASSLDEDTAREESTPPQVQEAVWRPASVEASLSQDESISAGGMQPLDMDQPMPRDIPQAKKRSGSKIPLIIGLAAILLLVGGALILKQFGGLPGGSGGETGDAGAAEKPAQTAAVRVSEDTTGISVLSSDWDWDSMEKESSGNVTVEDILWVSNESEYPIIGMGFTVKDENGKPIEDVNYPGDDIGAVGFIPAGGTGVMVATVETKAKVKHDDSSYVITHVTINEDMSDYEVPQGEVVSFTKDGDYYDIELANNNDTEVGADSIVVAAEFKDGKIYDADATGKLSAPIPANTTDFHQKAAFTDPHFYAKPTFENKTVYVVDLAHFGFEQLHTD